MFLRAPAGRPTPVAVSRVRCCAPAGATPAARPEQVRGVAEQAGFRSRDPAPPAAPTPAPEAGRRAPRRYRTGRNVQLNLKVRQDAADAFYALADAQGWVLGEAFERAIAALERDLKATR
jgi:hypothetical protein